MEAYPTEFEITDGGVTVMAHVKANDEHTVEIELPEPIGLHEWRILSDRIGECMEQMVEAPE